MSRAGTDYGIMAALVAVETLVGRGGWRPVHDRQASFLDGVFSAGRHDLARIPEIDTLASRIADELNAFLTRRGFPASFRELGPRELGSASVLDLAGHWLHPGKPTVIEIDDEHVVPAASLDANAVAVFHAGGHSEPIARVPTVTGDAVWMTVHPSVSDTDDLGQLALRVATGARPTDEFDGLVFPMIDVSTHADLSWLVGLRIGDAQDTALEVTQARQDSRLRMNESGIRARAATVVQYTLGRTRRRPLVIDRPFLLWIERPGLSRPLYVAWLDRECWRRPPDLGAA